MRGEENLIVRPRSRPDFRQGLIGRWGVHDEGGDGRDVQRAGNARALAGHRIAQAIGHLLERRQIRGAIHARRYGCAKAAIGGIGNHIGQRLVGAEQPLYRSVRLENEAQLGFAQIPFLPLPAQAAIFYPFTLQKPQQDYFGHEGKHQRPDVVVPGRRRGRGPGRA